ncbi:MAG: AAA family ATPase [Pseudomonadota bacterium]
MTVQRSFVVMADRDDSVRWLQRALAEEGELLVAESGAVERALQIIDVTGATVVFVEIMPDQIDRQSAVIEGLLATKPRLSVVALGREMDSDLMRVAMRAGARDFLVPGGNPVEVVGLVRRLLDRAPRVAEAAGQPGRIIALANARPDNNTIMLGLHLALAVQNQSPQERVLLLDLGVPCGDALLYLGLTSAYTFVDAVRSLRRLDETLIESAFAQHSSGLRILSMPENAMGLADITPTDIYVLLGTLRAYFPTIVMSLGGIPDSDFLYVLLSNADRIALVVEQSVPSCQQNMALLKRMIARKLKMERVGLVVDRFFAKLPPDAEAVSRGFGVPLLATLPPSGLARLSVMNSGHSMFEIAPRDEYCTRARRLAEQLLNDATKRPVAERSRLSEGASAVWRRLFGLAGG